MKRSRFTEDQIIGILKEHEAGVSVADLFEARRRREPFESSATGALAQLESNNDQDQTH